MKRHYKTVIARYLNDEKHCAANCQWSDGAECILYGDKTPYNKKYRKMLRCDKCVCDVGIIVRFRLHLLNTTALDADEVATICNVLEQTMDE